MFSPSLRYIKKSSSPAQFGSIGLLPVVVILAAVVLLLSIYFFAVGRKTHPFFLSGSAIAELTGDFMAFLEQDGRVAVGTICQTSGVCNPQIPNTDLAPRAWRMMANAALFRATGKEKYRDKVRADFEVMAKQWNTEDELFSLHQLEITSRLIDGEEEYLHAYVKGMEWLGLHSQQRYHRPQERAIYFQVMFALTAARQHAVFAALLDKMTADEKAASQLAELQRRRLLPAETAPLKEYRDLHFSQAERILQVAEVEISTLEDQAERNAAGCWLEWARIAHHRASGQNSSSFPDTFLLDFATALENENGNYFNLQSVTLCALVYKELTELMPEHKNRYHSIMNKIVFNAWDSPYAMKCAGNNGFLAGYSGMQGAGCMGHDLSASAWLVYLLADDGNSYRVR